MKNKIRVGILFGGQSVEHEVSLNSAKNILAALDKAKYEPVLIGIDKSGHWHSTQQLSLGNTKGLISPIAGSDSKSLQTLDGSPNVSVDVIFPILHGTNGEDGSIQGLLKLANIPFVGAGVLGSAVGMDKDVAKRLLRDAKIPIADFLVAYSVKDFTYKSVAKRLGSPFFLKPANSGSSVGVHKIKSEKEFKSSLSDAFQYDTKVIIEKYINGREIECSVLGNGDPVVSIPGEIIPHHEFYSYEAKYLDETGAELIIPAKLPKKLTSGIQETAVKAYKVLCCEGMARVDFFVTKTKAYVNEINTIPGFTNISMYPKLWEASGISQGKLIDRLVSLALERFNKERVLKKSFTPQLQS